MKSIIAIAALSVATFGLATQADAFRLSPASTKITIKGPTSLTANGVTLSCTSTFKGKTTAKGKGKITSFSATGETGCTSIVGSNFPWSARATPATNVLISNVAVSIPGLVSCGPGSVNASDNASGQFVFNATLNPGNCMVSGTVQSTPAVTIVP
jgi:hypothetical protein